MFRKILGTVALALVLLASNTPMHTMAASANTQKTHVHPMSYTNFQLVYGPPPWEVDTQISIFGQNQNGKWVKYTWTGRSWGNHPIYDWWWRGGTAVNTQVNNGPWHMVCLPTSQNSPWFGFGWLYHNPGC